MLSLYNKPFFKQSVIAYEHCLQVEKVDRDFMMFAVEFEKKLEEFICLLENEEEVVDT